MAFKDAFFTHNLRDKDNFDAKARELWADFKTKIAKAVETKLITYFSGQLEKGEKDGRYHFQFCMGVANRIRLGGRRPGEGWKGLMCLILESDDGNRTHIEKRRGTITQALTYVGKQTTQIEPNFSAGDVPNPEEDAERDLTIDELIHKCILQDGMSVIDTVREHPRLATKVRQMRELCQERDAEFARKNPNRGCGLWICWGVAGGGKSRFAEILAGGREFLCPIEESFVDRYDPVKTTAIVYDEADGAHLDRIGHGIRHILAATGGIKHLKRKGAGSIETTSTLRNVIITSNERPEEHMLKSLHAEQWQGVRRRFRDFGGGILRFGPRNEHGQSECWTEFELSEAGIKALSVFGTTLAVYAGEFGSKDVRIYPPRTDDNQRSGGQPAEPGPGTVPISQDSPAEQTDRRVRQRIDSGDATGGGES